MLDRVVIVACEGDAVLLRHVGKVAQLLEGELGRHPLLGGNRRCLLDADFVVRANRAPPDLQVAVLPLARRVVHEGELVNLAGTQVTLDLVDEIHIVHLEAQVEPVTDEVDAFSLRALAASHERHELLGVLPLADGLDLHEVASVCRQRVIHRRDAMGKKLALGLEQGPGEVHDHRRSRGDDRLDVVRMDIHEAGCDVAAVGVDDTGPAGVYVQGSLLPDMHDAIGLDHDLITKEEPVGLDDDSVPDDVHATS